MSYSTELKCRLAEKEIKRNCCRRSLLYGMLSVRASLVDVTILLPLDSGAVAELAAAECRSLFDREVRVLPYGRTGGRVRIAFHSEAAAAHLLSGKLSYPEKTPPCQSCLAHFLRGIFLAIGRMSDFTKLYRLEFSAASHADALAALLEETVAPPKRTERRGETLLYYKSNSVICDFLAVIGAETDAFALINDNIEAGYRNAANRRANCEARNIERSVEASMRFVQLIRRLEAADKLKKLPEELRLTARLRAENPTASLTSLGSQCVPPVSKSGMNHRLQRIEEMAKELLRDNKEEE